MPARHSDRVRRLLRLRSRPEARIQGVVHKGLRLGWRSLYPKLRRLDKAVFYVGEFALPRIPGAVAYDVNGLRVPDTLGKQGNLIDDWYAEWQDEFVIALRAVLEESAGMVTEAEAAWWSEMMGRGLMLDPYQIVQAYEAQIGAKIGTGKKGNEITETTRQEVAEAVQRWYGDPDMTLNDLADALGFWFSPDRAQLIAVNETTALVSGVTKDVMNQLGLGRWSWQTRLEFNVCIAICQPLHGKVFSINDPMPPDGSHIGCICTAAPVVE